MADHGDNGSVAVLVDCDNTSPEVLAYALQVVAESTGDGKVGLGALGQYMKRTNPSFAPKVYGHSTLSDMVRCYPELVLTPGAPDDFGVSVKPSP